MEEKVTPISKQRSKEKPDSKQSKKETPSPEQQVKDKPALEQAYKELPAVGNPENTVTIGGKLIEIKPTKLKYQRNRTALFYKVLMIYPLVDVLGFEAGAFGDDRDGDKCLMDFLIAATDDEKLIVDNYDDIDNETVEKIVTIFRRVNRIDEKEANQKKLTATKETA